MAFGWAVHLLTDAWTVRGVPLFWPLPVAPVRLPPRIVTGSWAEAVLLTLALVGLLLYATGGQVPKPWGAGAAGIPTLLDARLDWP